MSPESPSRRAPQGPAVASGPHARIALDAGQCTSCMLCVRECPTWCIQLESHQELRGPAGARRPRVVNVLDSFAIDWGLCMFCGTCVEVCPFDALSWAADPVPPAACREGLPTRLA